MLRQLFQNCFFILLPNRFKGLAVELFEDRPPKPVSRRRRRRREI